MKLVLVLILLLCITNTLLLLVHMKQMKQMKHVEPFLTNGDTNDNTSTRVQDYKGKIGVFGAGLMSQNNLKNDSKIFNGF